MIKYVCEDCGSAFHDRLAFDSHPCDWPAVELANGLRMCHQCWIPAPCPRHQPMEWAANRADGGAA